MIGKKDDLTELTSKTKTVYVKHFVQPIFIEDRIYTIERSNILGFITNDGVNYNILNADLNKESATGYPNISIKTVIESETADRFLHNKLLHQTAVSV